MLNWIKRSVHTANKFKQIRSVSRLALNTSNKYDINLKVNNVSLTNYIANIKEQHIELYKNRPNSSQLMKILPIINLLEERDKVVDNLQNVSELLEDSDKEIKTLAVEELSEFEMQLKELDDKLLNLLLAVNVEDTRNSVILEITAGVGGQEAMLFANEIFNMYLNFAEIKGWQVDIAEHLQTELGGLRFASLFIEGHAAFQILKFEGGVHRVQRVPSTEKGGRTHTSTISIAVLPQPTDIEVNLDVKDLKIETKRSTGAGGQHVNTTDSAVRIVHLPTGVAVECQTDRSQIKNRKNAMTRLKAILYQRELDNQTAEIEAVRKNQVRSNNRNEKIRTYNFSQDRITDHRLQGVNFHNLKGFMAGGQDFERLTELLNNKERVDLLLNKLESGKI